MHEKDLINPILLKASKRCRKCEIEKPAVDFNKFSKSLDGLQAYCRVCSGAYNSARFAAAPDKTIFYKKATIESRAKAAAKRRSERAADPDGFRQKRREIRAVNPAPYRLMELNRRGRKKAGGGHVSQRQWEKIKEVYGHRCYYCGLKTTLTMDHYLALASGGMHEAENIVPACLPCNCAKSNLSSYEFYMRYYSGARTGYYKSNITGRVEVRCEAL